MGRPTENGSAKAPAMGDGHVGGLGGLLGPAPATTPRPSGKAHAVRLLRAKTVGMRYRLVNRGHRKTRMTLNGKVVPKQTMMYSWRYEAEVTVKAVNSQARATREIHKVLLFSITQDGKTRVAAPKGATIVAFVRGGKEEFTINGEPAPDTVDDILEAVVSIANREDKVTADDIFSPKAPVQVGAIWPVHKDKMLASLLKGPFAKATLRPTPADVKGRAQLVAVKTMGGVPAMVVRATARIDNIAPAMGPVKATKGYMTMDVRGWGPLDTKAYGGGKTLRMRMHVEGDMNQGGKGYKLVMRFEQQSTDTETLLK